MWDSAGLQAVGGLGEYSSSEGQLLKIVGIFMEGLQMEACLLYVLRLLVTLLFYKRINKNYFCQQCYILHPASSTQF